MSMKNPKIIVILLLLFLGIGLFLVFKKEVPAQPNQPQAQSSPAPADTDKVPKIVSTKPDPLEGSIVSTTEIVEITFNRPLENVAEFKNRIDPEIDYKVELSGDRKTARILPAKPYILGTTYTLFIGPETKFEGVGRWGEEKVFHFRTIRYTGV